MNPLPNADRPIERVSRIFEKVFSPDGEGFTGFTVYYGGDLFANHIEFFTKDNRDEVVSQVETAHAVFCKTCPADRTDNE
jgi:hypothetical protein